MGSEVKTGIPMPEPITVEFIDATKAATSRIRNHLATLGREIHLMRTGKKIGDGFGFNSYRLTEWDGKQYAGIEDDHPDFEIGEPIICTDFYHSRWGEEINVTFPQSYLTADWRPIEQARIDAEKDRLQKLAERDKAVAKHAAEVADQREYERLKAKFESPSHDQ